jgi:hypothetical protein
MKDLGLSQNAQGSRLWQEKFFVIAGKELDFGRVS